MFFRSIRERICSALIIGSQCAGRSFLNEPENVVDLQRRAHDSALAAEAAADTRDLAGRSETRNSTSKNR